MQDPTCNGFHLIFLRNGILTYCKDELKETAIRNVVDALTPGGFLIIGSHEKLPSEGFNLKPLGRHPYIFERL